MINTEVIGYPVKVNREFVYYGLHKTGDVIQYNFSPAHRRLMESGAISEFEPEKYEYKYINRESYTIHDKKYILGDEVDISNITPRELEVFIKQRIISKDLKEEFKPQEVKPNKVESIDLLQSENLPIDDTEIREKIMGLTFKNVCDIYKLDVDQFCTKLGVRKVGLHLRKVDENNIENILKAL